MGCVGLRRGRDWGVCVRRVMGMIPIASIAACSIGAAAATPALGVVSTAAADSGSPAALASPPLEVAVPDVREIVDTARGSVPAPVEDGTSITVPVTEPGEVYEPQEGQASAPADPFASDDPVPGDPTSTGSGETPAQSAGSPTETATSEDSTSEDSTNTEGSTDTTGIEEPETPTKTKNSSPVPDDSGRHPGAVDPTPSSSVGPANGPPTSSPSAPDLGVASLSPAVPDAAGDVAGHDASGSTAEADAAQRSRPGPAGSGGGGANLTAKSFEASLLLSATPAALERSLPLPLVGLQVERAGFHAGGVAYDRPAQVDELGRGSSSRPTTPNGDTGGDSAGLGTSGSASGGSGSSHAIATVVSSGALAAGLAGSRLRPFEAVTWRLLRDRRGPTHPD